MKFNFRKIASVLASVVMLGSTVGIAAAANYPAPFVQGGAANVAVVYGSNAAFSDGLAAGDLQTNLQVELAKQTALGGSSTGASATGGDAINLASSSQSLYINSQINTAKPIITKDHLPTLLADGSAFDNSGTEYKYSQVLTLGPGRNVTFTKSGESMDPQVVVDTGYLTTQPLYNYTLTFTNKVINVSNPDVIGTATVEILGQKFTVGANSDFDTLYLYGAGNEAALNEGETKTVPVAGVDHVVTVVGVSDSTHATIEVDGIRKSVTKGVSYRYAGDFEVYVKDLTYLSKTGSVSSADLLLGAKTLHLENNQPVRYGADDTTILGTNTRIVGTTGIGISSVTISETSETSTGDFIPVGGSWTDRVFGGLKVQFADVVPALNASSRDSVTVDTDNAIATRATFTSYLAGSAGEKTIAYGRDADLATNSVSKINLVNDNNQTIHVLENETAKVGDWIVANDNDEGRIFQVISIPAGISSNDKVTLRDVITGENFDFATGLNNKTTVARTIGGAAYSLAANNGAADSSTWTVELTWGAGSQPGDAGTQTTLFPRIKLANGEWLSFLAQTTVSNATTYSLPGLYDLTNYKNGATLGYINSTTADRALSTGSTFGSANYTLTVTNSSLTGTLTGVSLGGTICNFNSTMGPAVLIQEPKTLASSNGNTICIPLTTTGSNTVMPAIGTPVFSDGTGALISLQSDTYKAQQVDLYGTLVERSTATGTNNAVTLKVPADQMYADVLLTSAGATVTPGSSSSGSVSELGNILVKDSEISSVSSKNLIVVGGSCINTVAAKILGSDTPKCSSDFEALAGVGANQALIKVVSSPYASDKTAMLIAGYEAADTTKAAKYVTTEKPATDKDTTLKLSTTSTEATVVA